MGLVQFWRSVSAEAAAVAANDDFDTAELDRLVRDVVSTFSYQPGGFMDLYVAREDASEQEQENLVFERTRDGVRSAAGALKHAAHEGDANPLQIRRALVDLETALLEIGMSDDATAARQMLNASSIDPKAAWRFGESLLRHGDLESSRRLRPLVRGLEEAIDSVAGREAAQVRRTVTTIARHHRENDAHLQLDACGSCWCHSLWRPTERAASDHVQWSKRRHRAKPRALERWLGWLGWFASQAGEPGSQVLETWRASEGRSNAAAPYHLEPRDRRY